MVTLAAAQNPVLANAFSLTAVSNATPAPVFAWEKGSGPGDLLFATPAALVTKAAFTAPGSYLVRLTADDGVIKSFVARSFDFSLQARWDFNTAGNVEGWGSFNLGSLTAAGGWLSGAVNATDPQISRSAAVYVSGDLAKHLLVRYRSSATGSAQWFWGRTGAGGFTGSRSVTASYTPANTWRTLLFDVTNHAEWKSRVITDLRFDPTGGANSTFDIDWMALSDGDFDNDGLTDLVETTTDTDNDGLSNLEDPDSDNDGLPDAWEAQYGLNRLSSGDAALDADGDGQTNLAEYTAGNHPGNPAEVFRIQSLQRTGGGFSVTIPARAGRRYVLERQTDSGLPGWTTIQSTSVQTGDGPLVLTDTSALTARRFYRVKVEFP